MVMLRACIASSSITGGPGGGSPMAFNGNVRKALSPAAPISVTTPIIRRDCLIFLLLITFISLLFRLSFNSSFLRTHFQPFTDVPSEKFAPCYKESFKMVKVNDRGAHGRHGSDSRRHNGMSCFP